VRVIDRSGHVRRQRGRLAVEDFVLYEDDVLQVVRAAEREFLVETMDGVIAKLKRIMLLHKLILLISINYGKSFPTVFYLQVDLMLDCQKVKWVIVRLDI
jgi:hypothetical protein